MGVQDRDWYWKDTQGGLRSSDRPDPEPFGPTREPRHYSPAMLVVAAIVGATMVSIAVQEFRDWRVRVAVQEVMRSAQEVMWSAQESMQKAQLQAQEQQREQAIREASRQAELQRQEAMRLQAVAESQRAEEDVRRASAAEADRKERAWAKFYRKPAACNDAVSMECANAYIRAKRTFEEKFARGEL